MGLKNKIILIISVLLIAVAVWAVESKIFINYNFMGNQIYNASFINATRFNGGLDCSLIDGGSDGDYCSDADSGGGAGGGANVSTTTCGGTQKVSAINNATGLVTCSADTNNNLTESDVETYINNSANQYFQLKVNESNFWDGRSVFPTLYEANITDLVHIPDTNASTACAAGEYFDGDDSCYNFNSSVEAVTNSTTYDAATINTIRGTLDGGNLTSIQTPEDDDYYNVSEAAGADPLRIHINFTGVTTFDSIIGRIFYDGGLGHVVQLEIQRSDTELWENYLDLTDTTDFVNIYSPVFDPSFHVFANGDVAVRFNHLASGIPTHDFFIDYLAIVEGFTALTVSDHDALAGRNSITNHPWAMPTNASRNFTGNVLGPDYNATFDYYFGFFGGYVSNTTERALFTGGNTTDEIFGVCDNSTFSPIAEPLWSANYTALNTSWSTDTDTSNTTDEIFGVCNNDTFSPLTEPLWAANYSALNTTWSTDTSNTTDEIFGVCNNDTFAPLNEPLWSGNYSALNATWSTDTDTSNTTAQMQAAVNATVYYQFQARNATDLICTNCIGGTEIAELADADVSNTLTCSIMDLDASTFSNTMGGGNITADSLSGTQIAELTDADISNTLTCSALTDDNTYVTVAGDTMGGNLAFGGYDITGATEVNATTINTTTIYTTTICLIPACTSNITNNGTHTIWYG